MRLWPSRLGEGQNVSQSVGLRQVEHRGPKTHRKSEISKKHRVYTNFFRKAGANFWLLPCDASQKHSGNCSERLVLMNFLFGVDFFGWIFLRTTEGKPYYCLRQKYCLINLPGSHLCKISLRILREINSPESQICNSVGPCSRHRKMHVSEMNSDQAKGTPKICNISGNYSQLWQNYLNNYFQTKVGKEIPKQFPEPITVGRLDVGNFAL